MPDGALIARFCAARRDRSLAVLEGLHALKHALRFDAEVLEALTPDVAALDRLASRLATDVAPRILAIAREVDASTFQQLAPLAPPTGVIALALRRAIEPALVLADRRAAPLVLLEDPRDLGNLGACVRVAAAADAAGVLSTGSQDPWHPDALRGGAGLQFALPVAQLEDLAALTQRSRPLLALATDGDPVEPDALDDRALLAFGSERRGLGSALSDLADARVSIPMRVGVSSLNLATSVAAVLFAWRLRARAASAG